MTAKKHEVIAKVHTRMGVSRTYVPKGTKGVGSQYTSTYDKVRRWEVQWDGKYGTGSHPLEDIKVLT